MLRLRATHPAEVIAGGPSGMLARPTDPAAGNDGRSTLINARTTILSLCLRCACAGDGVMVTTSVFEHKEAEEQSTFVAGEFVAEHLAPLLPNPPQVTAGEVVAYKAK